MSASVHALVPREQPDPDHGGHRASRELDLLSRETAVAGRELEVATRESVVAVLLKDARAVLTAVREHHAAADARDIAADLRDQALDLVRLLSPDDQAYGADWPARRREALRRSLSQADRASSRAELIALIENLALSALDEA